MVKQIVQNKWAPLLWSPNQRVLGFCVSHQWPWILWMTYQDIFQFDISCIATKEKKE
jgi:hypothetical protein